MRAVVPQQCLNFQVGAIELWQGKVGSNQRFLNADGARGREKNLLPDPGVTVSDPGHPVPADRAEECGAVSGGDASIPSESLLDVVFVRIARIGLRADTDGNHGHLTRLDHGGDVENSPGKGPFQRSDLLAVDPHLAVVVDPVEIEPNRSPCIGLGNHHSGAIPPGSSRE